MRYARRTDIDEVTIREISIAPRIWLLAAVLVFAQIVYVSHTYQHPLFGSDPTCQVCLLGGHVSPPVDTTSTFIPWTPKPTLFERIEVRVVQSLHLWSGSPRAPPGSPLE